MGGDTPFREGKLYALTSIKDNVSLLDEQNLIEINELIVDAGHRVLKKRGDPHREGRQFRGGDRCAFSH